MKSWTHEIDLLAIQKSSTFVQASIIDGAGDGLFAQKDIVKGDLISWIKPKTNTSIGLDPYHEDWFSWYKEEGCYDGAEASNRVPSEGPVGHLINDAASISPLLLTADKNEIFRYVSASEKGENCICHRHDDIQLLIATQNIRCGDEFYRSYGICYWLPLVESTTAMAMQMVRCDLRLTASLNKDKKLQHLSNNIFDKYHFRLKTLEEEAGSLNDNNKSIQLWRRQKPYRIYDGYGVYYYIARTPPHIRSAYAKQLGLYDFLDTSEQIRTLKYLHTLSTSAYVELVETHLVPPLGGDHFSFFKSAVLDQHRTLGIAPDLPW
uniref:SET domain-containing protein n=1 Tax=Aureoumbra lagunensis TaxID=44058 RepID=A0A7S3NM27_9STRA